MDLKQTLTWRNWIGKTGTLLSVLLLLTVLDGLVSRFREPPNRFSCLPGSRIAVSGPLREKAENIGELTYRSDSKGIRLVFEAIQTGFWLGENLWNGSLDVDPLVQPGEYTLRVQTRKRPEIKSGTLLQIEVHKDLTQLHQKSKSFLLRYLRTSPWLAALFITPLIMIIFGTVFFLSHKIEMLLAEQGKAEVYRVRKGDKGLEFFFGLGSKQGINPGTCLTILDKQGGVIGSITPQEIFEGHSIARVDSGMTVQPGFMIRR